MSRDRDRAYLPAPTGGAAPLPAERPLAVLIVSCTRHDLVETSLLSVAEHLPGLPVFLDRSSAEGPQGVGFAAAFNALVEQAAGDADLLLLRAGTRLRGPLTRTRELLGRPHVGAVSPMVHDDTAPGCAPWDVATRRLTLMRALVSAAGRSESLRGTPASHLYARQPAESPSVHGCLDATCLAISRAAWNSIGGFDEEFVRYGEAADWQARARAAGWRVLLADELGAERGLPETVVAADERRRDRDLARTNVALLLEHQGGVHHADVYLAGTALADRRRVSERPMRSTRLPAIVIVTNRLVYGGAERQKALLAAELDRRGYPVTLVCVQRFGPLINEIPPGVRVLRQPWWAPILDIPPGPAVLISGDTNTETGFATLWRAAAADRRWLVAAHIPPEEDRPIYSRPLAAAMRRADGFIALSQRHWDMLTAHQRLGERVFFAPNGVARAGDPTPPVRAVGTPPHLVMLSRIVEHKNPQLLIEALGDLADMPWTLSIFGDGPDRARLQARTPTRLRDRVQWRGWSPGPGPALADADLLCVPSRSEAFPLAILEAMARAVPVAASAVCAVPEMLDFGRAGFVVEPVSVAGWRAALVGILADPGALPAVGRRGFERMRTHYTVEAMVDSYLDTINAVL